MSTKKTAYGAGRGSSPESETDYVVFISSSQSNDYLSSDSDSEYEELVSRGQELHPLVRFRRIRSTKQAELSYHYNPDVPKNKEADMITLWLAAKRTVDGGCSDLALIIKEKVAQNDPDEEKLIKKLEVVLEDLKNQSKTFEEFIKKRQEGSNEVKSDCNQQKDKGQSQTNGDINSSEKNMRADEILDTSQTAKESKKMKTNGIVEGSTLNQPNTKADVQNNKDKENSNNVKKSGNNKIKANGNATDLEKDKVNGKLPKSNSSKDGSATDLEKDKVNGKVPKSNSSKDDSDVNNKKKEAAKDPEKKIDLNLSYVLDRFITLKKLFDLKYEQLTGNDCAKLRSSFTEEEFMEFVGEFFTVRDASKDVNSQRSQDIEGKFYYCLRSFVNLQTCGKVNELQVTSEFLVNVRSVLAATALADKNFPVYMLQSPFFAGLKKNDLEKYWLTFKENSKKGRLNLEKKFICKRRCNDCVNAIDSSSIMTPCLLKTERWVGPILQFAFISCVKDVDPMVRERTITTFSRLTEHHNENEGFSDIQGMKGMSLENWQRIVFSNATTQVYDALQLLYLAVTCSLKIDEWFIDQIMFAAANGPGCINADDENIKKFLFGMDGFFGYVQAFAQFVIFAFDENNSVLAGQMTRLNIGANLPLAMLVKYTTGSYPWIESLLYNFVHVYKCVWINQERSKGDSRGLNKINKFQARWPKEGQTKSFDKTHYKYSNITFSPPVGMLTQIKTPMTCGSCGSAIKKSSSSLLHPLVFQMYPDENKYPREVPKIDRPEKVSMEGHVNAEDMARYKRSIALVCSLKCQLKVESCKSPALAKLLNKINNSNLLCDLFEKIRKNRTIRHDKRLSRLEIINENNNCKELINGIHQENLKTLTKILIPAHILKIGEEEISLNQCTLIGCTKECCVKEAQETHFPLGPQNNYESTKSANPIHKEMKEYLEKLLVHEQGDPSCYHVSIWQGVLNYYTIESAKKVPSISVNSCGIEACELLDIDVLEAEQKKSKEELSMMLFGSKDHDSKYNSLKLYPFSIRLLQAEFIRKSCHKLMFRGASKKDKKALKSMFKETNSVIGIWALDMELNKCHGIILCYDKEKDVVFGFAPKDNREFYNVLMEDEDTEFVYPAFTHFTKRINPKCGYNDCTGSTNPNQTDHSNTTPKRETKPAPATSGLTYIETNHLRNCPHIVQWRGGFRYYKFKAPNNIKYCDPVLSLTSGMAFECKKVYKGITGQEFSPLDTQFWSLWPRHLLGIVISVEKINSLIDDNIILFRHTSIIIEVGTIDPGFVEVLRTPGFKCFALLSENYKNEAIIMIEYSEKLNSLVGTVIRGKIMEKLYKLVKSGCFEQDKDVAETLFGETGIKSEEKGEWEFTPQKSSEGNLFSVYESSGCFTKSNGNALWAGQLYSYFLLDQDVKGLDQDKLFTQLCKENMQAAVALFGQEDTGSIRNCATKDSNDHQIFTNRTVITGNVPDEMIQSKLFGNSYEGNSFIALNVEKSVINSVMDIEKMQKKSYYFNMHVHDDHYFVNKEMKENKHIMIVFTGFPDQNHEKTFSGEFFNAESGVYKNAIDRMLIVKYEPREGTLVAYYLKDRSKRDTILKTLFYTEGGLLRAHMMKFNNTLQKESEHSGKPMEGSCCKCGEPTKAGVNGEVVYTKTTKRTNANGEVVITRETKTTSPNNLGAQSKKEQKVRTDISPEREKKSKSPPKEKKSKSPPKEKKSKSSPKDESKSSKKDETKSSQKLETNSPAKDVTYICWCCGKEPMGEVKLSKCGGCRKAWYCSESCQTTDWVEHGSYCTKMQEKLAKKKQEKQAKKKK